MADETAWQRAYHESLQKLQQNREGRQTGPRYVTVKEDHDGQTAYVTKVDMRPERRASLRGR